jgi:hypothetical protein
MSSRIRGCIAVVCAAAVLGALPQAGREYLTWSAKDAERALRSSRVNGQVGGSFDFRITHTERSYNYKLRATWFTPEAVRAAARLAQLSERLTNDQTQAIVDEIERIQGTIIIVELDPREGSGVIPLDWVAVLQPKGAPGDHGVKGVQKPELRNLRALSAAFRRDYDYEVFWVVFPLRRPDGAATFADVDREAELVVRIANKEGRVKWPIPDSIRELSRSTR